MKPPDKPLSTDVLKDILARRKDDQEVLALLWELFRYRIIARKAHTLCKSIEPHDDTRKMMVNALLELLKDDPAVIDMLEWKKELLAPAKEASPYDKRKRSY